MSDHLRLLAAQLHANMSGPPVLSTDDGIVRLYSSGAAVCLLLELSDGDAIACDLNDDTQLEDFVQIAVQNPQLRWNNIFELMIDIEATGDFLPDEALMLLDREDDLLALAFGF